MRLHPWPIPCRVFLRKIAIGSGKITVVRTATAGASVAKDLRVMNIAGALPSSIGPALAPMVLAADGGSYAFLSAVAGACALASAGAVLRVRQVR